MGINRNGLESREFNNILMRMCPRKIQLIKASSYNCTGGSCFSNGRKGIDALCPICDGTGYLTGSQGSGAAQKPPFSQSPYSSTCLIFGDIQIGHGLSGSGGNYIKLLSDLGKIDVGDATLFAKLWDFNNSNGEVIYPTVDSSNPRPDRVISAYGTDYNVVKEIIAEIGNTQICRIFSLERNSFNSGGR